MIRPVTIRAVDRGSVAEPSLSRVLQNRRWIRREKPFPHIVAKDVFAKPFYESLVAQFSFHFPDSPSGSLDPERKMRDYDAYGTHFEPHTPAPFSIFISREWHDMLGSLFGVRGAGYINCGLHHHPIGSANGLVHNDLAYGWFADYASHNGIRLSRNELCRYTDGTPLCANVQPVEMVRAVSMLFYLANPPWKPGEGGETGLYTSSADAVERPAATVPPINNSILIFECTPRSFHAFLSNRSSVRNSAIMWVHRTREDAVARWADSSIVRFPSADPSNDRKW
jgi:hypothetical protein